MQCDVPTTCLTIKAHHRRRCYGMKTRQAMDNALGGFLRMALGGHRGLPKGESAAVKARVKAMLNIGEKLHADLARAPAKRKHDGLTSPEFEEWRDVIMASLAARAPFDAIDKAAKKRMAKLAAELPVWAAFAEGVRGFGAVSLAVIVGEAGDLAAYPKKGHLWKRMGLAVLDGVRQGGLRKSANKDDWIEHGYNAERRSKMFVIGDVLVKTQGFYRDYYLARKEIERGKAVAAGLTVAPSAKIPKARAAEFMADGHIHRRAQRAMEKRLLKDIHQAWREADRRVGDKPIGTIPPAATDDPEGGQSDVVDMAFRAPPPSGSASSPEAG